LLMLGIAKRCRTGHDLLKTEAEKQDISSTEMKILWMGAPLSVNII
jgi:hypothetical protein